MQWNHSRIVSVVGDGVAVVVLVDTGWDARPFGLDGGSTGVYPNREQAIEAVEGVIGEVIRCADVPADAEAKEAAQDANR